MMKVVRPRVMAVGVFLVALLSTTVAAAEFDCQKTAVCQRSAKAAGSRPAPQGRGRPAWEPSKTAVRMRLAHARAKAPATAKSQTASKTTRCRTKPAVCARLLKR